MVGSERSQHVHGGGGDLGRTHPFTAQHPYEVKARSEPKEREEACEEHAFRMIRQEMPLLESIIVSSFAGLLGGAGGALIAWAIGWDPVGGLVVGVATGFLAFVLRTLLATLRQTGPKS